MANSSRIFLPFALWPENPPSLSISSLFVSSNGEDLLTGTHDGFIICWKVISIDRKIIPRLLLIGHTSQVSFLVGAITNKLEQFVSISDNDGEIKLWNNTDGRCLEHIRTNLKHRSVKSFTYQLTNQNLLICCGCYSEILIYDLRTLEIKYTLTPSHVDADWISTFFIFQKNNAPDVLIVIGLLDSGCVKLWAFDPRTVTTNTAIEGTTVLNNGISPIDLKEHESKEIRTQFGSSIVPCVECQRMMLIVHDRGWQIFDGIDFTELCSYVTEQQTPTVDALRYEHWIDGHFPTHDIVILFSARGYGHVFRLPENATFMNPKFRTQHNKTDMEAPQWLFRLATNNELKLTQTPYFFCQTKSKQCVAFRADASGIISVWDIDVKQLTTKTTYDIPPTWTVSYGDIWQTSLAKMPSIRKILNEVLPSQIKKLTASCHLITMDRMAFGTETGQILIVPALQLISSLLLTNQSDQYKENFDIKTLIGHTQTITCLIHPHSEYSRYDIQHLISGSADHSIRLWDLSTNTQLHMFTVHAGTILMFHIPPPMLNVKVQYCICSLASDHTVALLNLKERKIVLLANRQSYPVVGLRWRINDDFLLIKCMDGSLFIWQIESGNLDRVAHGVLAEELFEWYNDPRALNTTGDFQIEPISSAMTIAHFVQIRSTWKRRDYEQIHRLTRKFTVGSRHDLMGSSSFKHTEYRLPIIIQQFHTNLGDDLSILVLFDLFQLVKQIESTNKDSRLQLNQTSTALARFSNLLISLLHPWSFDSRIDQICQERLHLNRSHRFLSYGILSKNEHLSLILPTWQQYLSETVPESLLTHSSMLISFVGMETTTNENEPKKQQERIEKYVFDWRWKFSSILNTQHLLSLVTMTYLLMNCDRWINNTISSNDQNDQALFTQREGWSKLLHFYCSDMIEQCQTNIFQSLSIEILCSHWQDLCLELRDAARKLLERELDHLHSNNDAWHIFLSKWSQLFHQSYTKETDGALYDQDIRDIFPDDIALNNDTTMIINEQYKSEQLLSIILIGIVGARYGQEIDPMKQSNAPIKGFTVESPEMILKLSRILTSLLSPLHFDHIPLHGVLRRTAIDLVGRGYTVWEPYLDVAQVLLALLDLSAIADSTTASSNILSGILTPKTDTCLTARTALNLIATSRSNVVIITLARELAKHALAQSGTIVAPTAPSNVVGGTANAMTPMQTSITIKNEQKTEILRLVKILIEKCPHEVAELILEVTDITLNCIDLSVLRHKGVQAIPETFSLLLRYPMVTYCTEAPKLCVGTKTGVLALYDLKTTKYQPFQAHPKNEAITCTQFSPDGKYLASYAAYEGILYFWQIASATFFGSSSTIRLASRHAAQRLERSIPSPMKKVDLTWLDRTSVRMFWHVDKSEKKFTV